MQEALRLLERLSETGGLVHVMPAREAYARLQAAMEINAQHAAEHQVHPGQGGHERYVAPPPGPRPWQQVQSP